MVKPPPHLFQPPNPHHLLDLSHPILSHQQNPKNETQAIIVGDKDVKLLALQIKRGFRYRPEKFMVALALTETVFVPFVQADGMWG